jgi:hypothetical protein
MAKHRAITLVLNIAINPDLSAQEVREQVQSFLLDAFKVEPPETIADPEWAPFDLDAASTTITRDEICYIDEEDMERQLPFVLLEEGDA